MAAQRIVPRAEHTVSRRDIDPDALKVLYRLKEANHIAYLVGGGVRDLLLGLKPKDFDVGTSAHPQQVKKLFRNCWIIGRRFRLAHVRFGPKKVVEVATFRRQLQPGEEIVQDGVPAPDPTTPQGEQLLHRDNTFGTPEEDAFRRDFTINALFYDIATFSVIDYVNGLDDLRARVIRCIGDPEVRFKEDPVRMMRAVAFAARLDFTLDAPVADAIRLHGHELAKSAPPRILEEYYKILRGGRAERIFRALAAAGLLEPIAPELHAGAGDKLWRSLAAVDAYRHAHESVPDIFTNTLLLGSLLVPLGFSGVPVRRHTAGDDAALPSPGSRLGSLPLARRDIERLRQLLGLQRRLTDVSTHPRVQQSIARRHIFPDALAWLEVHGGSPALVEHWKSVQAEALDLPEGETAQPAADSHRRRRRRRRRRPRPQV
ncbi:MAG TPA: polynucleotide adenylyltransferase PcnB [Vicinamibacterales bacterium]|jgi:poly(A) polymerase|nr:polynucleotide adenylyltransferase PcnB [Vicinamibacterales bacterium]